MVLHLTDMLLLKRAITREGRREARKDRLKSQSPLDSVENY